MSAQGPVGIVGVGNMGGAMAARLLALGWPVRVHDIDRSKVDALAAAGAVPCGDAAGVAQGVQALIVCVVDAHQAGDVLFGAGGAASALGPSQAVLLCPTIAPANAEAIAARLAESGIPMLDAPMSGGPQRARDGSMSLMVAGPADVADRLGALLQALAGQVFRVGPRPGDGARTKLVNNLLAAINLAGAAEVLALAERMGLEAGPTLDVIERSSGQSWIAADRMRRALAGDLAPRAHMTLLRKDSALAVEAAEALQFQGMLGPVARQVFERAVADGLGPLDDGALLQWFRGQR